MALFMSLNCSVPLICESLAARDISFILFISVSKFCKQLNNILAHSGDFNSCEKTLSVSNPIESSRFSSRGFLKEVSSSVQLLLLNSLFFLSKNLAISIIV